MRRQEVCNTERGFYYNNIEIGQEFKPYSYVLKEEAIIKYCQAVGEKAPIFNDPEGAKNEGYPALVAPPTMAAVYAFKAFMDEIIMPSGSLHATQEFEFMHPAFAGDVLTTTAKILDKFESRGRKRIIIEAITKNQYGKMLVSSRIGAILAE